ncbi:aKG-HExxH-type peptide beta-hydroxylase [Actinoplanes sp. RD1]|uniref:aKG-HExxH-type peptide beta-hydroxylase n=1 Tax=Actinoplanes sp. RD1 TaxID=3064538 RepID=UPI002741D669|nr:HEXXH motif-containing putative peptide modification protein [Actinoplanes sp. RD1]
MNGRTFVITEEQLAGLARGHGADDAIQLLVDGQLSMRRLGLVAVAVRAAELPADLGAAISLVARVDREAPERGRDLLRHPFLGAWSRSVLTGDAGPQAADYLVALMSATEPRGRLPAVIMDRDPLRNQFGKPVLPPLPPDERAAFARTLDAAWDLLLREQPAHASAMRLALRAIVPLRTPADGSQTSASARGSFGAIGMSVPDDPVTAAELLVHEFQHEKLNALLDLLPLCAENGPAVWHAPWRPDPRPASALLQGVYAFTGVTGFWKQRRLHTTGDEQAHAERLFAHWHEQVCYALDQLMSSGELTQHGKFFVTELGATLNDWAPEAEQARQTAKGAMS